MATPNVVLCAPFKNRPELKLHRTILPASFGVRLIRTEVDISAQLVPVTSIHVLSVTNLYCTTLPPPAADSNAGGAPAPAEVSTCPSLPVAIATGLPLAS